MNVKTILENSVGKPLSDREAEFLLFERTAYPVGDTTAKELYKAVNGFHRAVQNGLHLCEHCDRMVPEKFDTCFKCYKALRG
jgi:hypothetical protein